CLFAVYESGNPANKHVGVQTYVVGPGSAATFDVIVESAGAYPLVTHSLTGALRGAIAVLVASPDAKPGPLMPHTPWKVDIPQTEIIPTPAPEVRAETCDRRDWSLQDQSRRFFLASVLMESVPNSFVGGHVMERRFEPCRMISIAAFYTPCHILSHVRRLESSTI